MRKILLALLLLALPTMAAAQTQFNAGEVFGNSSASRAPGRASSLTALLDRSFTSTRGSLLYRSVSGWTALTPGTANQVLTTGGPGADISWANGGGGGGGGSVTIGGVTSSTFSLTNLSMVGTTITAGTMAAQDASAVSITGGTITGLPSPSASSDAVNKAYADSISSGINNLGPSRLATAAILPNSPTYSNGTAGVGATLTAGSNSTLTVDGTVANLNDVVLVQNQASAFQNGIYTVTTAGSGAAPWVLTRATYFDQAAEMKVGSYTLVTGGSTGANKSYTLSSTVTTVGTDALTFTLFSSGSILFSTGSASTVTATSANTGFANTLALDNSGTVSNAGTIAGVKTILSAGTNVFGQMTVTGGASPTVAISSGAGATGGLTITAGAGTLSLASPTTTGLLTTAASTTSNSSILVPHGTAPTSPTNGAFWSTTSGFFGRVNGVTVGPFGPTGVTTCSMTSVSTNTSLASTFCQTILVDATSGARTITLYAPGSSVAGFLVDVKKIDSSTNNVIVVVTGAGAIDGGTSVAIGTQWSSARFQVNSSQWYLL